jgi:hypothetical protein
MAYKMRLMTTFSVGTTTGVKMSPEGVIAPNLSRLTGAVIVETDSFADAACLGLDQTVNMCLTKLNKDGGPVPELVIKLFESLEKLMPDRYLYVSIGSYRVEKDLEKELRGNDTKL